MSTIPDSGQNADDALQRLKAGNARFVAGTARFSTVQKEILADLAKGQHPYATILGCSDSRVPPELIFDAGFGELFIIRVAGNVLSPEIAGSLQYAGRHLHTPLFVVLGHTNCGAVAAAIDTRLRGTRQHSRIQLLVESHPARTGGSRSATHPGGNARASSRGKRSLDHAADSRNAGRPGTPGRRASEARRRDLRNRNGPRAVSRMSGERCPCSRSQISPATDSLERLSTRRPSDIAMRCRRLGSRARDACCSR